MMKATDLAEQIEKDFPGIWARIDKAQPGGKPIGFPIVTESVSRIYPQGTQHPSGFSLRYLMSADTEAANRKAYKQVIDNGVDPDSVFVSYSADALQGVAAWRTTRLHYEFDPDFYDALAATPMKGTPPAQIFQRLPAKSFFLSRKGGVRIDGDETLGHGFFVVVFDDRLMMMPLTNNSVSSGKFVIRLNQDSVESALDRLCEEGLDSSIRVIQAHPNGTEEEKRQAVEQTKRNWPRHEKRLRDTWGGALSCLMYLCTEAPDIDNKALPTPKATRLGMRVRYLSPKHDTQVSVGIRLGAVFRKQSAPSSDAVSPDNGTGAPMPPHIRRAHWHTYWIGRKGEQKPELKWLSPILVNTDSPDQLSETIHRVQSSEDRP